MGKKQKLVLKCRQCGKDFKTFDRQTRLCKPCVKKEAAQEMPKGPKSIEDMIK